MADAIDTVGTGPTDATASTTTDAGRPALGPHGVNSAALQRMKSIEGQIRGIEKMILDERYCMDIVDQISAVRAALAKVSENVLRRHIESCVVEDLRHGSEEDQDRVVNELMDAFARRMR
ncbi:MAG TPA: metal-sensitive transcriptional regulator [Alkalispirochaeta sp.]|nr:metal-sensitive transcriptional regulator [Alkalispirochaeta sp.]